MAERGVSVDHSTLVLLNFLLYSSFLGAMEALSQLVESTKKEFKEASLDFEIEVSEISLSILTHELSDSLQLRALYQKLLKQSPSIQDRILLWDFDSENLRCMPGARSCPANLEASILFKLAGAQIKHSSYLRN